MRLIDADALNADFIQRYTASADIYLLVRKILNDAPTVDAVEVVHGEWQFGNRNGQYGYYCSKCNTGFTGENAHWIAKEHLYCPRCGAKMDGERKASE